MTALYPARLGVFEDAQTVPIAKALCEENLLRIRVKQEVNLLTDTAAASFTSSTKAKVIRASVEYLKITYSLLNMIASAA